jgi:phosphoenolpyruvate carboxykinase (GTP)
MAMLPFLGYHVGDYFQHWLDIGTRTNAGLLPKIFYVNWFRRGDDDEFLWPGFGENSRILEWALRRIEGTAEAEATPLGNVPTPGDLDLTGLKFDHAKIAAALRVDPTEWITELRLIDEWFATIGGNRLPDVLREELAALRQRLAAPASGYAATIDPRRDPVPRGGESRWAQPRF